MPLISLMGLFTPAEGEATLEGLYLSQLAAGTSSLLATMRAHLADLNLSRTTDAPGAAGRWAEVLATGRVPAALMAGIKHPWSTSRVCPMATNVQIEM